MVAAQQWLISAMNRVGRPLSVKPKRLVITESQANQEWSDKAWLLLKQAMNARNWGYQELAEGLSALGIKRTATAINRRINRGNFSAGFFLACLAAMEPEGLLNEAAKDADEPKRVL